MARIIKWSPISLETPCEEAAAPIILMITPLSFLSSPLLMPSNTITDCPICRVLREGGGGGGVSPGSQVQHKHQTAVVDRASPVSGSGSGHRRRAVVVTRGQVVAEKPTNKNLPSVE